MARRLRELHDSAGLRLASLQRGRLEDDGALDAIAIPTEYWWGAWKRARAAGLRGPFCLDFHQLPYVGTLDVLTATGIQGPAPANLARLPFALRARYRDGLRSAVAQTIGCMALVRSVSLAAGTHLQAGTSVVAKNLAQLGYRGPMHVPRCWLGIDANPIREVLDEDDATAFDAVYVGRFHPHKGFLDLPFVVAHLRKLLRRDVTVAVCGGSGLPGHMARFWELVRSLGIEGNLAVQGRISKQELYRTIRRSKVLLYPSYVDGFSITVLESLCLGVPVVAYGTDAVNTLWGYDGAVVAGRVGDPKQLAVLAARLLEDSAWQGARAAARQLSDPLLRRHTWEEALADQRRFYEDAAASGISPRGRPGPQISFRGA